MDDTAMMGNQATSGTRLRVLLGVTGSIAAYKAIDIVRRLQDNGCEVRVVLTQSARQVVGPAAFEAITGHPCMGEFWREQGSGEIEHITWADWAQCIAIAPATADCIAKMRLGLADTPLLATVLAARCPVVIAPAMNVNMWHSEPVQEHTAALVRRGLILVGPDEGHLACGWQGAGRLADTEDIVSAIQATVIHKSLKGHHVVVSLGPTREPIDPVRFLTNRSSGKMGCAIIEAALARGAVVTAVHGPLAVPLPSGARAVSVDSAQEMNDALHQVIFAAEEVPSMVIMAAAVADYRVRHPAAEKVKRGVGTVSIELEPNPDILRGLSQRRAEGKRPLLIGFAVETIVEEAALTAEFERKRIAKGVELLVGNRASDAFDLDTNTVYLVQEGQGYEKVGGDKRRVAERILDRAAILLGEPNERVA